MGFVKQGQGQPSGCQVQALNTNRQLERSDMLVQAEAEIRQLFRL